ncbi:hypothetical protein EDD80_11660 [Anseongella ginsenosidimutans]|uniref:Uncharacterized protein n=1 Tax=Anseongella ginsenosidimutans TaxID=496056 RepID=A0A4R3KMH0_9SPHI|nr:hypothetical protein [Anseongella ginsenosidimutans]QEC53822.1 hypothetical protein FRZ59_16775 [Anseongella ginsenosidimutans]TCS84968.1 hypothetical protein EDD80_11660 [Anseongella ginsenosidimutans]
MDAKTNQREASTRKNTWHLAYWTGSWVLTVAIATFGPEVIWDYNSGISLIFILINAIVGIGMILMNRKYINGLDELQKKVNTDAMAIAFGVGVVGGMSYSILDITNVIPFEAEISFLIMLVGITYLIGVVVSNIRYR